LRAEKNPRTRTITSSIGEGRASVSQGQASIDAFWWMPSLGGPICVLSDKALPAGAGTDLIYGRICERVFPVEMPFAVWYQGEVTRIS
jgi:hypothetical protein